MLNLTRALNNDRLIRALTGLNRKAFDALCVAFDPVYEESLQAASKPRKRARGQSSSTEHSIQSLLHPVLLQVLSNLRCSRHPL